MKTHELRSLQVLRQLREKRSASLLVAQQRRCQDIESELDLAKQRLHLHREHLVREAQQAYAALDTGVSVADWCEAQMQLDRLTQAQLQLEHDAGTVTRKLDWQAQVREEFRQLHVSRQRRCEAWDAMFDHRKCAEQRAEEYREDSDEGVSKPAMDAALGPN
jgi:flagellar biosynthesis chaperone FliJ